MERERAARKQAESLLEQKSRELYEANENLRDLAERTRAIVDTAADGIVTYDIHGTVLSFNRSAQRIFARQQVADFDVRTLFSPQPELQATIFPDQPVPDNTSSDPSGADISAAGETTSVELVGIRPSGCFPVEIAVSRTIHQETTSYTALVRDLSRRKQVEARLQQAQKMESVGQLAAGIAHEINTPIQFVSNNIQFLQGAFDDLGALLDLYDQLVSTVQSERPTAELLEQISEQSELADLPFFERGISRRHRTIH